MKISVICVTNRNKAIDYLYKQLDKQTFSDFEVIIANDSTDIGGFKPRQKEKDDVWNLNKAYNDCLEQSKGELLVFLQDFIWIPANGLERFWEVYEILPDSLITGCGHKYDNDLVKINEVDDRVFGEKRLEPCHWSQWELNWASCPKAIMPLFDENMDKRYGGENQYIARTAYQNGYEIYIDRTNECKGYNQEYCGGRPIDWEDKHFNKI